MRRCGRISLTRRIGIHNKPKKIETNRVINIKQYIIEDKFYIYHNNYVDNKKCIIVIPIYKSFDNLHQFEIDSLTQCMNILSDEYEICFLLPCDLEIKGYEEYFKYQFSALKCHPKYFSNVRTYSDLCMMTSLYEMFQEYKYMLIYQLDAWVFRNDLEYWCDKNYEYIGAPIHDKRGGLNGGFSLRLIESFIKKDKPKQSHGEEDRLFSKIMETPNHDEAMLFAVQDNGCNGIEYVKNEKSFGVHYIQKNFSKFIPRCIALKNTTSNNKIQKED